MGADSNLPAGKGAADAISFWRPRILSIANIVKYKKIIPRLKKKFPPYKVGFVSS